MGNLTEEEKDILYNMQGFLQFALDNDMEFFMVLGTLGHDVTGLFAEHGKNRGFSPRTTSYGKFVKS